MKVTILIIVTVAAVSLWGILPVAAQQGGADQAARIKEEAAKPTPRLSDGHPDLTGFWSPDRMKLSFFAVPVQVSPDGKTVIYAERDAPELDARAQPNFKARAADRSRRPPYKPEFLTKQRELMYTASNIDPGIHCYPAGVPRIGAPSEIVHTPTAMYLMYADERDEDQTHTFRIVPIVPAGTKHKENQDPVPVGHSIAFWEGDTLVVDVVDIDPETWLDGDGDFHSDALHVIERFTRKGNTLEYDVTIEDPKLFTGPWKPVLGQVQGRIGRQTRILREPGAHVVPDYACVERDREHKVNNDRF